MEFLHDVAGVVHRDLKPENVLFKSEATRGGRRDTLKARPCPSFKFISGVLPEKARLDNVGVIKVNYT